MNIDVCWWFKELLICYKYGEKLRYRRALDKLTPYLGKDLARLFEDIYEDSLWLNPISGKKGW